MKMSRITFLIILGVSWATLIAIAHYALVSSGILAWSAFMMANIPISGIVGYQASAYYTREGRKKRMAAHDIEWIQFRADLDRMETQHFAKWTRNDK